MIYHICNGLVVPRYWQAVFCLGAQFHKLTLRCVESNLLKGEIVCAVALVFAFPLQDSGQNIGLSNTSTGSLVKYKQGTLLSSQSNNDSEFGGKR